MKEIMGKKTKKSCVANILVQHIIIIIIIIWRAPSVRSSACCQ